MRFRSRSPIAILCLSSLFAAAISHAQTPPPAPADDDDAAAADEAEMENADEAAPAKKPGEAKSAPAAAEGDGAETEPDEAEMEAEMAEAEGPSPSRPPAKGKGVIWGVVREKADNEPTIEATVTVVGTKYKALTDIDGRYRLELPPGTYRLRVYYELHVPLRFESVRVEEGKVAQFDAELEMQQDAIDTVEIETEVNRATVEGEILTRQRAAATGDSVGRVEIAKTPDRNAAQAAQRVVGATIVGGRFVYVRGLGERYTNAQLNGAPLPSPEPDRAAIPLDLFPTLVLDSITIAKTFTPDSPADFAGGSVRIETREIPSKFLFQTSLTGGFNTQTTFRERPTYEGGNLDWLGIDDGGRALPSDFPKTRLDNGKDVDVKEVDRAGKSINTFLHARRGTAPPDHGISVVAGNGWKVGDEGKFGVLAAINYSHSYLYRKDEISNEYSIGQGRTLTPLRAYRVERGTDTVNWGGFGSVSYRFNDHHKLTLLGLHTQIADDTVQITEGSNAGSAAAVHDTRLAFVGRSLDFGQLQGDHEFKGLGKGGLQWTAWLSRAARDEPDSRATAFRKSGGSDSWTLVDDNTSGRHFWSDQTENGIGGKVDWSQPLFDSDSKVKLGALVSQRSRDFNSRSLALRPSEDLPLRERAAALGCPGTDFDACVDGIFTNSHIGPVVRLFESTMPVDSYKAKLGVYAGYLMTDVKIAKPLRLVLGERLEVTRQTIDPFDQFHPEAALDADRGKVNGTDLLPSASIIAETSTRTKVRAAVTRTLARPQLRELAPFAYQDYFGGRFTSGNPHLALTHITNVDLRFEFFPTLREVLAISGFYKDLRDPIERVTRPTGDRGLITFANAQGARLYGAELEARKGLDFVSDKLKNFSLIANLTLAKSKIELSELQKGNLTSQSRPMINQAPYVFNLALDYSNDKGTTVRALYNLVGPRIVEVGSDRLPDAYEHRKHQLDLTLSQDAGKHFQIKFVARNLLFTESLVTQGKKETAANVLSRYSDGAVFALTGTYTY